MHHFYTSSSAAAQTAYAGLSLAARQAELARSAANLPGGFARKVVSNHPYWYYQYKGPDGKAVQLYVGPENDEARELMAEHANPSKHLAQAHLRKLCEAAQALGCTAVIPKHARVLKRLSDHGFFKAGSVLVGTHTFLSYQNLLGVHWHDANTTQDLDFAHAGKNLTLALPANASIDTRAAIASLAMGFVPTASQTTYQKSDEPDFDLDFLTTKGRRGNAPVFVASLNITLQPLAFMEFSMEDTMVTTLLTSQGPIVVNIPRPERYCVHKLIIHGERGQDMRTKANKDLVQAAALMAYLFDNDTDALQEAWRNAVSRGAGWKKRAHAGAQRVADQYPQLASPIAQLMDV
jgi:hypothetical protein